MPPRPRPEIELLRVSPHGGFHAAEWNALGQVIDFSSNVNPFGVSPRVRAALRDVPIERHPDPDATALRDALASRLHLPANQIIVGNGSLELIRALAMGYLRAGDTVFVIGPTFGEYRVAAEVMGAHVQAVNALARDDFRLDVDAVAARVAAERPRLAFICNPNNPTGACLSRAEIERLLAASDETMWVLDEAFRAFAHDQDGVQKRSSAKLTWRRRQEYHAKRLGETWYLPSDFGGIAQKPSWSDNLVVVRSMTKDYALAGLRLGYAFAHREVIAALDKVRAPWSVNSFAQAAGLVVLEDDAFLQETLAAIRAASVELRASIARLGWRAVPSAVHFFLVEVGDAQAFRAALAARGLIVRDCTSFGLPEFVRIATRKPEENAQLVAALTELRG